MSKDMVIEATHLSKKYRLYDSPHHRLVEALHPFRKRYHHDFWALSDVSFHIRKGDCVGIIGRNGSGKSTLLQILCGVLQPTTGKVAVNGKIAALLELGAGFNPELTGRENVYLNGTLIGVSRKEMDRKFPAIASFADIGEFIDQPVKTYSSGMYVRLAFAAAVNVDPDILIVDEALSVGDFYFQQKCLHKLKQFREQGVTLLFVSHDMSTIRDLCAAAIYLRQGQCVFVGETRAAVRRFFLEGSVGQPGVDRSSSHLEHRRAVEIPQEFRDAAVWTNPGIESHEEETARILALSVEELDGRTSMKVMMGDQLVVRVLYQVMTDEPVHVSIVFKNKLGQIVTCNGSYALGTAPPALSAGERAVFELTITCMLEAGLYTFSAMLGLETSHLNRCRNIAETPWLGPLTISWDYEGMKAPFLGLCGLPSSAQFIVPGQVK